MGFKMDIPSDFLEGLMAEPEEFVCEMLDGAAPILVDALKDESKKHRDTGAMADSIKQEVKATKAKTGAYITVVRPTGKDKKGVRNMEKMMYMEYGTSRQVSTPVLSKAVQKSEKQVIEKMREIYNQKVGD